MLIAVHNWSVVNATDNLHVTKNSVSTKKNCGLCKCPEKDCGKEFSNK